MGNPVLNVEPTAASSPSQNNRVKVMMKFEGRELQFKEQGKEVLLVSGKAAALLRL